MFACGFKTKRNSDDKPNNLLSLTQVKQSQEDDQIGGRERKGREKNCVNWSGVKIVFSSDPLGLLLDRLCARIRSLLGTKRVNRLSVPVVATVLTEWNLREDFSSKENTVVPKSLGRTGAQLVTVKTYIIRKHIVKDGRHELLVVQITFLSLKTQAKKKSRLLKNYPEPTYLCSSSLAG